MEDDLDKLREEFDELLEEFLSERNPSEGGYAKITREDENNFKELIHKLIRLKCEPDCDYDYPLEVKVINRHRHQRMHYEPLPYFGRLFEEEGGMEWKTLDQAQRMASINLRTAQKDAESVMRTIRQLQEKYTEDEDM